MLTIKFTSKMKKDIKLMERQGRNMGKLADTLDLLASCQVMPEKYQDHQLKGNLKDFRECHIEPDWLLIYQIFDDELVLSAVRTGSHSKLLKK